MMERKSLTTTEMKIDGASISKILSSVPEPPYKNWQLRDLTELRHYEKYYLYLIGSVACKELLTEMEKDPRVKALYKHLISCGYTSSFFEVSLLGSWFLWACNKYSFEIAKINLNKFLNSETVPIMITTWVMGIEVKDSIELENGVRIVPIEEMPDSEGKEKFLMQKFNIGIPHTSPPSAAVTHICKMKKSFSQMEHKKKSYADVEESYGLINKAIILLNAIKDISCIAYMSTAYSMPMMPMGIFAGGSGRADHMHDVLGFNLGGGKEIKARTISELNTMLSVYDVLPENKKESIIGSLSRLSQAKRRREIDRILDLCIALEMVLSDKKENGTRNSMTFSLRGCWLIGRDNEHRKSVYNDLKELYKCRSKVIHSGSLESKDLNASPEKIDEYIRLTEEIILAVMRKGKINWKNLILGG